MKKKLLIAALLISVLSSQTIYSSGKIGFLEAFVAGMIIQSVPPLTWLGMMMFDNPAANCATVDLGVKLGMATMATIQVFVGYCLYRGLRDMSKKQSHPVVSQMRRL